MLMKLYGSSRSPYVRKATVAAIETGLHDRIEPIAVRVSASAVHAGILEVNPLGKIPTLVLEDGRALYDSLVICEYLDLHGTGTRLFPRDPEARIEALRWHALGNGLTDLLIAWFGERRRNGDAPSALAQAHEAKCRSALDALERTVGALDATPFGIGHVAVGVALGYADFRFDGLGWRTGRPGLAQWFGGVGERASFVRTVPYVEGD